MAEDVGDARREAGSRALVQVVLTQKALVEITAIQAYVGQFNPLAAQRLAQRIRQAGDSLDVSSDRGRPISLDRRELTTTPPYVIRYRQVGETVFILEIRHSARHPN